MTSRSSLKSSRSILRPALRYHGAKFRLAPWILQFLPPHVTYVEPFAGAASVLLLKSPAQVEVYNDRDQQVVNFFRILRERPDELIYRLGLTPCSRVEYELAQQPTEDPLEQARRLYVRALQTWGGPRSPWRSGWRYSILGNRGSSVAEDCTSVDHLWAVAERLRRVQLENDEALAILTRYDAPTTLHYLDPPYLITTRKHTKAYQFEMTDLEHQQLAAVVQELRGMVILSGYPSKLYDQLYQGWDRIEKQALTTGGSHRTEILWLSPNTSKALENRQISLFEALPPPRGDPVSTQIDPSTVGLNEE